MDDPPPQPVDKTLGPDAITDAQIEEIGPALVCEFEAVYKRRLKALWAEAIAATDLQVPLDEMHVLLRDVARRAKEFEAALSEWTDRLGDLTTPILETLEDGLGDAADTILKAINAPDTEESGLVEASARGRRLNAETISKPFLYEGSRAGNTRRGSYVPHDAPGDRNRAPTFPVERKYSQAREMPFGRLTKNA